jgi:hypothetical protein
VVSRYSHEGFLGCSDIRRAAERGWWIGEGCALDSKYGEYVEEWRASRVYMRTMQNQLHRAAFVLLTYSSYGLSIWNCF